jgi:hypothetical protein
MRAGKVLATNDAAGAGTAAQAAHNIATSLHPMKIDPRPVPSTAELVLRNAAIDLVGDRRTHDSFRRKLGRIGLLNGLSIHPFAADQFPALSASSPNPGADDA